MMLYEILENQDNFSEIERNFANYVLNHANRLEEESAREISKKLFISPSAITRFCQKIGFDGYPEFCKAFLEEHKYLDSHFQKINPNIPFLSTDSDFQIASKINALYQETIMDTHSLIQYEALEQCAKLVNQAQTIYILSAGTQNQLGVIFQEKLARIGKKVLIPQYIDIGYHMTSSLTKQDCMILISYSGETESIIKVARKLNAQNMPFIAITSYGNNTLASFTNHVLYLSTREKMNRGIGNYCSNISTMYLLDVLYSCIFKRNYDENLNHKFQIAKEFQTRRDSNNPILKDD